MSDQLDQNKFRKLLLQQQQELKNVESTGSESAKPVELDQTRVGRLSRMDALQSQAMSVETEQRRKLQLQKIKAAFKRLDDGDYGYCQSCDEPINENRLNIDPCATLCIGCASAKEKQ